MKTERKHLSIRAGDGLTSHLRSHFFSPMGVTTHDKRLPLAREGTAPHTDPTPSVMKMPLHIGRESGIFQTPSYTQPMLSVMMAPPHSVEVECQAGFRTLSHCLVTGKLSHDPAYKERCRSPSMNEALREAKLWETCSENHRPSKKMKL